MSYQDKQKKLIQDLKQRLSSGGKAGSTVVEMRNDYEHDLAICLTSVVFPPDEIKKQITTKIIEPLREIQPNHHYYSQESLHLTIKSIRSVGDPPFFSEEDVEKVQGLYGEIIQKQNSFKFDLKGVMGFPTSASLLGYSDERLLSIVNAINSGLIEVGVPDNKTYLSDTIFFGNITFCRYTEQPSEAFLQKLEELSEIEIGTVPVKELSLITCNAVCSRDSLKIIDAYPLK